MLPESLARLVVTLADVLAVHMTALDAADERSRTEHDAYSKLEAAYRDVAAELHAAAREMARDAALPMGRHDLEAMSGPRARDAFAAFVKAEEELLALLEAELKRDRKMLDVMQETIAKQG